MIRNRTKEVVGTITTDANGMGELSHLLKDEYTLKESKAPDGYEKGMKSSRFPLLILEQNKLF